MAEQLAAKAEFNGPVRHVRVGCDKCGGADLPVHLVKIGMVGAGGGGALLCRKCFRSEMHWRSQRNRDLEPRNQFQIYAWPGPDPVGRDEGGTMPAYCVPANCGLASSGAAVGKKLGRLLDALEAINSHVCDGEIVEEVRGFRLRVMERLRDERWRITAGRGDKWQVLEPNAKRFKLNIYAGPGA